MDTKSARPSVSFRSERIHLKAALIIVAAVVPVLSFSTGTAHSQTAASQLCEAAGQGLGCIGAATASSIARPAAPNIGGAAGGILLGIGVNLAIQALSDPGASPAQQQQLMQQKAMQEEQAKAAAAAAAQQQQRCSRMETTNC